MLKFGTGGRPLSTVGGSSVHGIKRIRELNLDCMEIEWVHGAPKSSNIKPLEQAKTESEKEPKVVLSCHGSYYINLAGDDKIAESSKQRIFNAAKALTIAGGRNVVFHPAFYKDIDPIEVHKIVVDSLEFVNEMLGDAGISGYILRPETTGKPTQYGSLEEIVKLSKESRNTAPCIDFAHLHARSAGEYNMYTDFAKVLEFVGSELGDSGLQDMHIHLSGIEYTAKGERKHLPLEESDMNYKDLLKALKDFDCSGTVICESPILEEDAKLMKDYYLSL